MRWLLVGRHPVAGAMTAPTPDDRYWEERAQLLEREALSSVRKAAENWRTGIIGLTSFIGIAVSVVGLVVVPTERLGNCVIVAVGSALCGCFVLLVVASWLAMSAAYGQPKQIITTGSALREWAKSEAGSAANKLAWSRRCAGVGLVLLFTAASMLILLPRTEDAMPMKAITITGQEFCGSVSANPEGAIVLTAEDGTVRTIAPETVAKASFPASC